MRWAIPVVILLLVAALVAPALADKGGRGRGRHDGEGHGGDGEDDAKERRPAHGAAVRPSLAVQQAYTQKAGVTVFSYTVRNGGLASADGVTLHTSLPPGVDWSTRDPACELADGQLDCDLGKVPPKGQRIVLATAAGPVELDRFTAVAQAWSKA